jgi:SAM-dependent methyltransferase
MMAPPSTRPASGGGYYADKRAALERLFGTDDLDISVESLRVNREVYPIVGDVIRLTGAGATAPGSPRVSTGGEGLAPGAGDGGTPVAADIRDTFGAEWQAYPEILPEHEREFRQYFDLVPMDSLRGKRVADLGCGMGRWSYFLRDLCGELVLVDFSEAIFVARKNLADCRSALFFQADLQRLPFPDDCFDFVMSIGVLHHLPTPALDAARGLSRLGPRLLFYLYYRLDNRPLHFRVLLGLVTATRGLLWRVRSEFFRRAFSWWVAALVYQPLIALGRLAERWGRGRNVPLYEFYRGHSLRRIRQDVYDRFFTRIEQRVTRREILELRDTFAEIRVSEQVPFWHFVCERDPAGRLGS